MRGALVAVAIAAGTAHADKRLVDLRPQFAREAAACEVQASGVAKVHAGAITLVERGEAGSDEVDALARGLAAIREYCAEVAAVIAFIDARARAPYRSVERELDTRYRKIVQHRTSTKRVIEELGPTTRKIIPKLAARRDEARPKPAAARFPSGREVVLPSWPGTWRLGGTASTDTADYAESGKPPVTASASVRAFGGDCEQQRQSVMRRPDVEAIEPLEVTALPGVAWSLRFVRREQRGARRAIALCMSRGLLATADVAPADRAGLADELVALLARMIAARPAP